MTIKEQILQELDRLPEFKLAEVLQWVRALETEPEVETESHLDDEVWQAYLKSEREHEEVYRRLADS